MRSAADIKHATTPILFVVRSKLNKWGLSVGFKLGEGGIGILGR